MNNHSSNFPEIELADVLKDIFDGPRRVQFIENGVPYIRLADLESGEIYLDPNQNVGPLDIDPRYYLVPGDVLVTKTGDEPRSALVSDEARCALTGSDIFCLRLTDDKLSATWLSYFFNTTYGQGLLIERSTGATVRRLRLADLRSISTQMPPLDLVKEVEQLEQQAQQQSRAAHEIWTAIRRGMYSEIDDRAGISENLDALNIDNLLASQIVQAIFQPLREVAKIAISSRKMLKENQSVQYVQVSDIDPQSFLFRRSRRALVQELPSRIRLPIQMYQVLLLASGSNLGMPGHPVAVVDQTLDGGFASNAFLALEFNETPIYYAITLKHPLVLAQIRKMSVGEVVSTLRKKDIVNLRIPVLSSVWRQDFNDRAKLAWERRSMALELRRRAMLIVEGFVRKSVSGVQP